MPDNTIVKTIATVTATVITTSESTEITTLASVTNEHKNPKAPSFFNYLNPAADEYLQTGEISQSMYKKLNGGEKPDNTTKRILKERIINCAKKRA